ncbi:tail-specific protease [Cytophagales bacterium WSM2-2]|nr:tail-specific protease [Cytophagales bacterium WSM2-2]
MILENHVSPPKLDEGFLFQLKSGLLTELDPYGLYFTESDLKNDSISISIVNLEGKGECRLASLLMPFFKKKLIEADLFIASTLSTPLSFIKDDSVSTHLFREHHFAKNKVELRQKWKQLITLDVLMNIQRLTQPNATSIDSKTLLSFEKIARNKVLERNRKKIKKFLESDKFTTMVQDAFLKSLAHAFDPHTEYFSETEMKLFQSGLSTTAPSFGFELKRNNWGEVSILRVVPGSSAWNSNEVHKGDILLQVRNAKGEFSDVDDFDVDPDELIKSWGEDQIELKLKKADGKIATVKLFKGKIESVENRVQGFVLDGQKKIGYVSLPSFYKEWNSENSNEGCSNDLAKEIIKLKKEGIEGLILDLRFNGGGSIEEAIDVTGIFIDGGPVAVVKTKDQALLTLKDSNRGSVYDGPLVVMVNGASASASEFVAAALQDYNRALIVGTSTYGKGTGQIVLPVNSNNNGFIKVTMEKLYRITGRTNQKRGVKPDIAIPDLTDEFVSKEIQSPSALLADSVSKKLFYTALADIEKAQLKLASNRRTVHDQRFLRLDSMRRFYRKAIPLKIESFSNYFSMLDRFTNKMEIGQAAANFKVIHNQFDNSVLTIDPYRKSISDESSAQIRNSVFIDEAYLIISDYVNMIKK